MQNNFPVYYTSNVHNENTHIRKANTRMLDYVTLNVQDSKDSEPTVTIGISNTWISDSVGVAIQMTIWIFDILDNKQAFLVRVFRPPFDNQTHIYH